MAGEQDILSLGLNIESFDANKKKILKEYITLFDSLAKYDGKIFNPVMGDGLNKFNTSIAETSRIVDELNAKLTKLNSIKVTQKTFPVKEVRQYADETERSTKATRKHSEELAVTNSRLEKLGAGLTKGLGYLRNIAYILPGLGIAGIFNLAFEAIGKAAEELGIFSNKEAELLKKNIEINKSISEQIELYKQLLEARKKFVEDIDISLFNTLSLNAPYFSADADTFYKEKIKESLLSSRGFDQGLILEQKLKFDKLRLDKLSQEIRGSQGGDFNLSLVDLQKTVNESLNSIDKVNKEISFYSETLANKSQGYSLKDSKQVSLSRVKLLKEEAESRRTILLSDYEKSFSLLKNYYDAKTSLDNSQRLLTKFNEDQQRKLVLETTKDNISLSLEKNKKILSDNKKFHDEKDLAIRNSYENERSLNQANLDNVLNNLSSTPKERLIAENKFRVDNAKADLKQKQDLERNDVEFYQRKLLALTEIEKDEVEMEALKNERLFLNEKHSLSERLDAYENYIIGKQKIKDLEYSLAIQKDSSKLGGPTSLTPEEQQRIGVHRDTQKFNVQADAEKKTYEIVHQYLELQLKDVIIANEKERQINKEAYAKELSDNNERFKNKIFAYEAFKRNKEIIDKKYGVILSIEDEIKDDEEDVSRLQKLYEDLFAQKKRSDDLLKKNAGDLDDDKTGKKDSLASERFFNEELGINNALNDAILKARKELDDAIAKKDNDKVKAAKARYEQLIQFEKEHAENRKEIQEGLFELAGNLLNGNVENEIRAIQDITRVRDEQFAIQEKAIESSSLDSKNKAALEIQLAQQKLELDKQAIAEERKLKHEAAVRDRELAIAHVMWNTIESVTSALRILPPAGEILAAERGILGALQLANILAVPIPSYREGTNYHKGGFARYGEDGPEIIKAPGREPFVALSETISNLPEGTKVIPLTKNHPEFDNLVKDESWEQTRFLAKQMKKSQKDIVNIFKPTIVVDMNFESRKRQILGN